MTLSKLEAKKANLKYVYINEKLYELNFAMEEKLSCEDCQFRSKEKQNKCDIKKENVEHLIYKNIMPSFICDVIMDIGLEIDLKTLDKRKKLEISLTKPPKIIVTH